MKIFIMTDMEGVCGVIDRKNWVLWDGRYYEEGRKLLTLEVNAAAEGFFKAGATEIYVIDGHGHGGVNQQMLDPRTHYVRGFPDPWPFTLDSTFDAVAFVGQHAKAGTEYAHISHTGNHYVLDCQINGVSVGEFGQLAMCAAFLGVHTIFCSGDQAAANEAGALVRGIETVAVKRGLMSGTGNECTFEEHINRNIAAVHMHPVKARELIKEGAEKALRRFINDKNSFQLLEIKAPYIKEIEYRPGSGRNGYKTMASDDSNLIRLMNTHENVLK